MFTEPTFETPGNVKVKRWDVPEPEEGVTLRPDDAGAGTVQEPIFCQPPCATPPEYQVAHTFFAPANVPLNVTVAATVIVLPENVADTVEAGILHWLLDSVALPPTGVRVRLDPLSSAKSTEFEPGSQMK